MNFFGIVHKKTFAIQPIPGNLIACISGSIHKRKISQIKNCSIPKHTAAGIYRILRKWIHLCSWLPRVSRNMDSGKWRIFKLYMRKRQYTENRHAVDTLEDIVVGHVPHAISCLCSAFIRLGAVIDYIVEGTRCYSSNLPQGGICKLIFKRML